MHRNKHKKNNKKKVVKLKARDFYTEFKYYRETIGCVGNVSMTTFGRDLKEYDGIVKKKSSGIVYSIDYEKVSEYLKKKGYFEDIEETDGEIDEVFYEEY